MVYGWDTDGSTLTEEVALTAAGLRDSGYEVREERVRLPAGDAVHLSGAGEHWELSMFVLEHEGRFVYLECGHGQRHDGEWQAIATSLELLR